MTTRRSIKPRRTPVHLLIVSLQHAAVLKRIAAAKQWTLKTAVENAIEQAAAQMGIEVLPVGDSPVRATKARAAA